MEEIEQIKKEIKQEYTNTIDFENVNWKVETMKEVEEDLKTFFSDKEEDHSNASWEELNEMFADEVHFLETLNNVKFIYSVKYNDILIVFEPENFDIVSVDTEAKKVRIECRNMVNYFGLYFLDEVVEELKEKGYETEEGIVNEINFGPSENGYEIIAEIPDLKDTEA